MTIEDDLNVENFIFSIKNMSSRDRNKITANKLQDLIVQYADQKKDDTFTKLESRISILETQYVSVNAAEIHNIASIKNLQKDINDIKDSSTSTSSSPTSSDFTEKISELEGKFAIMQKQVGSSKSSSTYASTISMLLAVTFILSIVSVCVCRSVSSVCVPRSVSQ